MGGGGYNVKKIKKAPMRFLCQSAPFLSPIRRGEPGERGYLGNGAKLDNVFMHMLT